MPKKMIGDSLSSCHGTPLRTQKKVNTKTNDGTDNDDVAADVRRGEMEARKSWEKGEGGGNLSGER